MSINFLLQSIKFFHDGYTDEENLNILYDFLSTRDTETLLSYASTNSIISYNNDLELYIESIDNIIPFLESKEEYEKCHVLKLKKEESLSLVNNKQNCKTQKD